VSVNWVRRGRLFEPAQQAPWIGTHAALPVVDEGANPLRLYFTSRDAERRSRIGGAKLGRDPIAIGPVDQNPLLTPGALGAFDDAGVTSSCVVRHNSRIYLFYTGWSLGVTVPFYLQIGVAVSGDGVTFRRLSLAPLLDRNPVDPYLTASPWVLIEGSTWRMWYVSGTGWERIGGEVRHRYHIKYAESQDGVQWRRTGLVAVDYASRDEYAFGRPCVLHDAGRYKMWYSSRGKAYRIGYAESSDGLTWTRRDDEGGLTPSSRGWDSDMTAYPAVFRHDGKLHMLYNGNGYGLSGIGLAVEA